MSTLTTMFKQPKAPVVTPTPPPKPIVNSSLNAQIQEKGRRSGLMAAAFGYNTPSGKSTGHTMTGQ